ncbi:MAG TPA: DNA translocase FtsK 4TM domain-containing protein, partial [Ignavibacteriales bacterium]|nr:DNA translocase FtsK 4TM domain-containing protein [Ignavibacteriales bacterium]
MSLEKKRKLIGLFMAVFALLLFLSIISYSAYDEANLSFEFSDLFKAFSSDPDFADKADSARNWLGVFGAYVSDFFVNNILGYFSLIFRGRSNNREDLHGFISYDFYFRLFNLLFFGLFNFY